VSSTQYRFPTQIDLYRKFHDYCWSKLADIHDELDDNVPDELRSNSSPVKGSPETTVVAKLRSTSRFPFLDSSTSVLRLARSVFLETQTAQEDALITPMTIHVLNFVVFPDPDIRILLDETKKVEGYVGLPIFGADIVSLPGNKHLVVLDFQPVIPLDRDGAYFLPERYSHIASKLKSIHSRYQHSNNGMAPCLPWGGDIPSQAKRFFSPYALWSRLTDDDAIDIVNTSVWSAFQEYFDLYLEFMRAVQKDVSLQEKITSATDKVGKTNQARDGQIDYLEYRRLNDPARPMLQRLYGESWTERVIAEVLFPDLLQL
jgi:phycoerythrobilin:ferredoxin oxidoreductase